MKNKNKNNNIEKRALRYFTLSSCDAIKTVLKDVNADDLITGIYFKINDDDTDIKYMLGEYEKQLILSKVNYTKFTEGLHEFYLKMYEYIKTNKLYKKFFKLVYLVYIELNKKNTDDNIASGYFDLLIQQYAYFGGGTKTVVYGIDSKGKLLTIREIGNNLTEINYELHNIEKRTHDTPIGFENNITNIFKKYGHKPKNMMDIQKIIAYDQNTTNMLFSSVYFINEENKFLLPVPFYDCNVPVKINELTRIEEIEEVKNKLTQRQILLPSEGVNIKFKNCGDIKEIYFKEEILDDDTVILLFKIKFMDNACTLGWYDTKNEVFYDLWKGSSYDDIIHLPIMETVLQNYMYLTCQIADDEKTKLYKFNEVQNLNNAENNILPYVFYEIKEKQIIKNKEVEVSRHFDRSQYRLDIKNVAPFLRNLPVGASASDEAIEMAKRLGIELPEGKTFVRGFKKSVYKNIKGE